MNELIMMYVFFDRNGDIKAIGPSLNSFSFDDCLVTTVPLGDVEPFLTGKKTTYDYQIKKLRTQAGEKFTLTKKIIDVNYVRTLDNFLTEIGPARPGETIISIVNQKFNKSILVEISPEFKEIYTYGTGEQKDDVDEFLKLGQSSIYITEKHNPYRLLFNFSFIPSNLFHKEKLYFSYSNILENTSAYTKKLINGYSYKEK